MMKKTKNTNFLFAIVLIFGALLHIFFLFIIPYFHDETHYATVPFRLMNGDSLIQHEWHLTQFASLFSFLPVRIWTAIKGSADGIFIFLRCVYLLIHTTVTIKIYQCFKEYGKWAILASMMFYAQITYRIQAISYQSMFVVFLLLFTLCLLSIYKKQSAVTYIFAGVCFGCCCICNPLFCLAFILYLIGCAIWTKRNSIIESLLNRKALRTEKSGKKLTKRQKREQKQQIYENLPSIEEYTCFFNKEAILRFTCGILIIALIAVVFFFVTGGTIDSIFDNMENLLGSSEYDIASSSGSSKFEQTLEYFTSANLGMPWILPLLFIALLFDKKRITNTHRFAYLSLTIIWAIIFIFAVLISAEFKLFAVSLPFFIFSIICYLLTEKKNKTIFYCVTLPCIIATVIHYLAADTHLAAIGVVLSVANVAGVLFTKDLWYEMQILKEGTSESPNGNTKPHHGRKLILVAFCLQILFYGFFYAYGQIPIKDAVKANSGPYSGLYMSEEQYVNYSKAIDDLNYIKNISKKDDPILLASYENWMYLYVDRPIATYTTWYRGSLDASLLRAYYKENPSKKPKYIYIEAPNLNSQAIQHTTNLIEDMFEFTSQELSNGVLLTVERCKF